MMGYEMGKRVEVGGRVRLTYHHQLKDDLEGESLLGSLPLLSSPHRGCFLAKACLTNCGMSHKQGSGDRKPKRGTVTDRK